MWSCLEVKNKLQGLSILERKKKKHCKANYFFYQKKKTSKAISKSKAYDIILLKNCLLKPTIYFYQHVPPFLFFLKLALILCVQFLEFVRMYLPGLYNLYNSYKTFSETTVLN